MGIETGESWGWLMDGWMGFTGYWLDYTSCMQCRLLQLACSGGLMDLMDDVHRDFLTVQLLTTEEGFRYEKCEQQQHPIGWRGKLWSSKSPIRGGSLRTLGVGDCKRVSEY